MINMHVYRLVDKDTNELGSAVTFYPKIPYSRMRGEDNSIARICCAPSIYDCIISKEIPSLINKFTPEFHVSVYAANVNVSEICQPLIFQVPDVWHTNEFWILSPQSFVKIGDAVITKQMDIPNSAYARYMFTMEGEDPIVDRVCAKQIYGNNNCFSFIDACRDNFDDALTYAESATV